MNEDEKKYTLTPWGCMRAILSDYGYDPDRLTPTMGVHMVEDFLEAMTKAGYIAKEEEKSMTRKFYKSITADLSFSVLGDSVTESDFLALYPRMAGFVDALKRGVYSCDTVNVLKPQGICAALTIISTEKQTIVVAHNGGPYAFEIVVRIGEDNLYIHNLDDIGVLVHS